MTDKNYSTNFESQRERLLAWLMTSTLTTLQARQELREAGHNIVTHWTEESTGKAKHRVARYALLAEVLPCLQ